MGTISVIGGALMVLGVYIFTLAARDKFGRYESAGIGISLVMFAIGGFLLYYDVFWIREA